MTQKKKNILAVVILLIFIAVLATLSGEPGVYFVTLTPFLLIVGYFLPSFIAGMRKKKNTNSVFILNLFLGWTLVGWVIALVWAVSKDNEPTTVPLQTGDVADIEKLAELKEKGIISEAEFEAKKKKILES